MSSYEHAQCVALRDGSGKYSSSVSISIDGAEGKAWLRKKIPPTRLEVADRQRGTRYREFSNFGYGFFMPGSETYDIQTEEARPGTGNWHARHRETKI